jgi:hypothetical protein
MTGRGFTRTRFHKSTSGLRTRMKTMNMGHLSLATPDQFPSFPYLPYEIQLALMRHLYENIEGRHVTIVESPTGTVSSVSYVEIL